MFTGIYENYNAARLDTNSLVNLFDGHIWVESVKHATVDAINNIDNPDYPCQWYERELITLLALEMTRKGCISVLDFGGGPATTFASIIGKLPSGNLQYHIVDTPANCELGKSLFPNETRLHFLNANPDNDLDFQLPQTKYDIILSSSTIQYSHNWRQLIKLLIECDPEFFVLLRLLTGPMPTFTAIQSVTMSYGPYKDYYVGAIPCTFVNRNDLSAFFELRGYDVFLDIFGRSYDEELKQLPAPYCNGHLKTMIFIKKRG